jgi:hypothetical protein
MGEGSEADHLKYLVCGTGWPTDGQLRVKLSENGVQAGKYRGHLLVDAVGPDAHLLQIAVLERRPESDLVIDEFPDSGVASEMTDIASDRHVAAGVEPGMPTAQFLTSWHDPLTRCGV